MLFSMLPEDKQELDTSNQQYEITFSLTLSNYIKLLEASSRKYTKSSRCNLVTATSTTLSFREH